MLQETRVDPVITSNDHAYTESCHHALAAVRQQCSQRLSSKGCQQAALPVAGGDVAKDYLPKAVDKLFCLLQQVM